MIQFKLKYLSNVKDIELIDDIRIVRGESYYMLSFPSLFRKFSSAPFGGGTGYSNGYLNRSVPKDYRSDPVSETLEFLRKNSIEPTGLTVTLTACKIENAIIAKEEDEIQVLISVTGGSSNALSIGSSGFESPGTINIAVISDAEMQDDAAMNLFMGITEAKSQALSDLGIRDRKTGKYAPGTSTDSVSLFLSGDGKRFRYGGRLTQIGQIASVMVYNAVKASLTKDCTELS